MSVIQYVICVPWVNSPPKFVFKEFCISHYRLLVAAFKVHSPNYNSSIYLYMLCIILPKLNYPFTISQLYLLNICISKTIPFGHTYFGMFHTN